MNLQIKILKVKQWLHNSGICWTSKQTREMQGNRTTCLVSGGQNTNLPITFVWTVVVKIVRNDRKISIISTLSFVLVKESWKSGKVKWTISKHYLVAFGAKTINSLAKTLPIFSWVWKTKEIMCSSLYYLWTMTSSRRYFMHNPSLGTSKFRLNSVPTVLLT